MTFFFQKQRPRRVSNANGQNQKQDFEPILQKLSSRFAFNLSYADILDPQWGSTMERDLHFVNWKKMTKPKHLYGAFTVMFPNSGSKFSVANIQHIANLRIVIRIEQMLFMCGKLSVRQQRLFNMGSSCGL
ncbi:hypothetical protein CR513_03524, partial [Mucuna pruriens]